MKEAATVGCLTRVCLLGYLRYFSFTPVFLGQFPLPTPTFRGSLMQKVLRTCWSYSSGYAYWMPLTDQDATSVNLGWLGYGTRAVPGPRRGGEYAVLNFGGCATELFRRLTKIPKLRALITSGHSFQG